MALALTSLTTIGEYKYYISSTSQDATLPQHFVPKLASFGHEYIPTTLLQWNQPSFEPHDLESICQSFEKQDDVWTRSFLSREPYPKT
jgi:hypothetical protein